jgi:hypothetical protein
MAAQNTVELQQLGFALLNVRPIKAIKPTPGAEFEIKTAPFLRSFLTSWNYKSENLYIMSVVCIIVVNIQAYPAQSGLTKCFNCDNVTISRYTAGVHARRPPPYCSPGGESFHDGLLQ